MKRAPRETRRERRAREYTEAVAARTEALIEADLAWRNFPEKVTRMRHDLRANWPEVEARWRDLQRIGGSVVTNHVHDEMVIKASANIDYAKLEERILAYAKEDMEAMEATVKRYGWGKTPMRGHKVTLVLKDEAAHVEGK